MSAVPVLQYHNQEKGKYLSTPVIIKKRGSCKVLFKPLCHKPDKNIR